MLLTMRCYAIFDGFLLEKEDSMMFREKVEGNFEREKRTRIRVCTIEKSIVVRRIGRSDWFGIADYRFTDNVFVDTDIDRL